MPGPIMTREEYDAQIPMEAMEELKSLCLGDPVAIEETLEEQYQMYLESFSDDDAGC